MFTIIADPAPLMTKLNSFINEGSFIPYESIFDFVNRMNKGSINRSDIKSEIETYNSPGEFKIEEMHSIFYYYRATGEHLNLFKKSNSTFDAFNKKTKEFVELKSTTYKPGKNLHFTISDNQMKNLDSLSKIVCTVFYPDDYSIAKKKPGKPYAKEMYIIELDDEIRDFMRIDYFGRGNYENRKKKQYNLYLTTIKKLGIEPKLFK